MTEWSVSALKAHSQAALLAITNPNRSFFGKAHQIVFFFHCTFCSLLFTNIQPHVQSLQRCNKVLLNSQPKLIMHKVTVSMATIFCLLIFVSVVYFTSLLHVWISAFEDSPCPLPSRSFLATIPSLLIPSLLTPSSLTLSLLPPSPLLSSPLLPPASVFVRLNEQPTDRQQGKWTGPEK